MPVAVDTENVRAVKHRRHDNWVNAVGAQFAVALAGPDDARRLAVVGDFNHSRPVVEAGDKKPIADLPRRHDRQPGFDGTRGVAAMKSGDCGKVVLNWQGAP